MIQAWLRLRENWIWVLLVLMAFAWFGRDWLWRTSAREIPELRDIAGVDPEIVQAVASLVSICRQSAKNDEDFLRLGLTYHANGLTDLAIQTYTEYLKSKPKSIKARYLRALAYLRGGDIDRASEDLQACKDLDSTFAPVYWRLALLQSDQGQYEEALDSLRIAEMHAPRDLTIPLIRSKVLLGKGELQSALEQMERHDFREHPNEAYARFLHGSILRQLGREEEALLLLDESASRPEWTDSWQSELQQYEVGITAERIKASALFRRNMFDACIPMIEKIIEAGRADHRDYGMLASSYLRKGDLASALKHAAQAVVVSPRDFNSWMNLGNMQLLASARLGPEYLGQALNSVTRASELRPERWEPHDARGQILQIQSRRIEALDAYRTSVQRAKDIEMCEWHLIYLLMDMERMDEVVERLDAIPDHLHRNPYYLYARAVVAQRANESSKALAYLAEIARDSIKDANLVRRIQVMEQELRSTEAPSSPKSP